MTFAGELQADAITARLSRRAELDQLIGDARDWPKIRAWSREIATALQTQRGEAAGNGSPVAAGK
jgi:menaquinone-dependent protoporphyrinogen oxidase